MKLSNGMYKNKGKKTNYAQLKRKRAIESKNNRKKINKLCYTKKKEELHSK
jgi:hypothetical protein